MKKYLFILMLLSGFFAGSCGDDTPVIPEPEPEPPVVTPPDNPVNPNEVVYDETGCLYTSYNKLVMCGYQGWFSCSGDPTGMGWVHYPHEGALRPGSINIDFWPDMTEYEKKYVAPNFKYADDSQAYLFSSGDYSTVDLHFKWMKDYGIDGVFVQRFVSQTTGGAAKTRVNMVLEHCLKAAKKYERAIAIMYDGSAGSNQDYDRITSDWNELVEKYKLFDNVENPTFLRHNGKPVFSLWGYGFTSRGFDPQIFDSICENICDSEKRKVSIMLGVPYNWRTLSGDCVDDERFHESLKKWVDIIMPWGVGRYDNNNVASRIAEMVPADLQWCKTNQIDYVPTVSPGFSWANMHNNEPPATYPYDQCPRNGGDFFWTQVVAARQAYSQVKPAAQMLYVAMFDEMDEGTCIFKCETASHLPLNTPRRFVGYEDDRGSDHYLWLAGKASELFHGVGGFGTSQPIRN
ncbi:MAG: xylosidase [Dysgonamonadaceae bacterium]|jgi:hypothetical protein|nr:xylosidase [Dysgonamonadaceae bacterium]